MSGTKGQGTPRYLTALGAWALAFGCGMGWGAFYLTESAFLPAVGRTGTAFGLALGALAMLAIAANYHFMMNRCPAAGGTYAYARSSFGVDHGFLTAWFLVLTYSAIVWVNAAAFPRAVGLLLGGSAQFGFRYTVAGASVYLGELLLSLLALFAAAALCLRRVLSMWVQIALALALLIGAVVCCALSGGAAPAVEGAAFSVEGVLAIAALSPLIYVGFESVCHTAGEAIFRLKLSFPILAAALVALCLTCALLSQSGAQGGALLGFLALCACFAGMVGGFTALTRLLRALSDDALLAPWFGAGNNALRFLLAVSAVVPFLGWTVLGWIVDVTAVTAAVAYAISSAAALKTALHEKNPRYITTGAVGFLLTVIFITALLSPNLNPVKALSAESYLLLALWGILGFFVLRGTLLRDKKQQLGHSVLSPVILLGTIILTSSLWLLLRVNEAAGSGAMTGRVFLQAGLCVVALAVMMDIFFLIQRRERQTEIEKAVALEASRVKGGFLANMSHEIRTPMNAIIGLDSIALRNGCLDQQTRGQLEKIGENARRLLGLINDTLDMGLIEAGRMMLMEEEFPLRQFIDRLNASVNDKCAAKGLHYECAIIGSVRESYRGDEAKLKRILGNVLDNAVKFTDAPGQVMLAVEQTAEDEKGCSLRFIVRDTGIGVEETYLPHIFEPFSQEDLSNTSRYGGSGLGLAIAKSFTDMMHGSIEIMSKKGAGTTVAVTVPLKPTASDFRPEGGTGLPEDLRAMVVDGDAVSGERARTVLRDIGVPADWSADPWEAIERIRAAYQLGHGYGLVITDYKLSGMNGLELTRMIRQFDGNRTAIIMLTGYNWDILEEEALDDGVDSIGAKPLFSDSLLREIQTVLARKEGRELPAEPESEATADLSGRRVLMAEDLELNKEILEDILSLEDIRSEHAENGKLAVEMFADKPQGYYDAILMDVRMPVMDGLSATEAIRRMKRPDAKTIPIIAMTANVFDEDIQRSLQAGMNAHLPKPVEPDVLFSTLGRLIAAAEAKETEEAEDDEA